MLSRFGNDNSSSSGISLADLRKFYEFSLCIADAVRALVLELWREGSFSQTLKEDKTPVTVVDLKAEELARSMISGKFPDHGIAGEEYEPINSGSGFQWTVDPIDGTQNLVNRIPTFGTLIGLRFNGQALLGVIDHPVMDLRTSGGPGIGVFHNGAPVTLADISGDELTPNDLIATNTPGVFGTGSGRAALFSRVMDFHPHSRIYYDCYGHTLAVLGRLAVVVEPGLKIWDITPVEAMMAELGGGCEKFNTSSLAGSWLTDAVFGKRRAVQRMCAHLGIAGK